MDCTLRGLAGGSRRGFLALLAGASAAFALPGILRGLKGPGLGNPPDELCESDRLIASLGRRLRSSEPATAACLSREVEARLPGWSAFASRRRRAALVRARFLNRRQRDADLEREEIVLVDGWVLARSEAAAAVYLSLLVDSSRQS